MKTISVIIPDTNSPLIGEIIARLQKQSLDPSSYEILVVGTDSQGLVTRAKDVQFIPTGNGAYASDKRNIGMQAANGEIFLFIDDDCLPLPGLLKNHLEQHQSGNQVVGGAVTFERKHYLQLVDNVSAFHDLLPHTPAGPRPYLCTSNLSVHRPVVDRCGKMIAHHNRAEDLEWTVRMRSMGYSLIFEPRAVVVHVPDRYTFARVWRHWTGDAPETLAVRLKYADLLKTPYLARFRSIYLWGALAIAGWATWRIFSDKKILTQFVHTLPVVYLTKLAWCWGAFTRFPHPLENL
jgi:glycosyltransferase involved in cell wall biosynthesis